MPILLTPPLPPNDNRAHTRNRKALCFQPQGNGTEIHTTQCFSHFPAVVVLPRKVTNVPVHPQYGSYVFIGEIVTNMPLPPTGGEVAYCEDCGACVTACHGACLPDSRDTCVSAITQKKGELSVREIALIKQNGLIWGCDRCQEVCPHNRDVVIAPHPCFDSFTSCFIENDPDFKKRAYAWRGEAVIRRNIEILKEK